MKFSILLGKNLISLGHAKDLGTVYNCAVDNKLRRINQIATIDNDENEGFVQNKYVNLGEDTLFTVSTLADYEQKGILFPFRARVFDTDGNFLGKVSDFDFENNQILNLILTKDVSIKPDNVVVASTDLVIVKGKRKIRACVGTTKREKMPIQVAFNEVKHESDEPNKNVRNSQKPVELELDEDYNDNFDESFVASDEITPQPIVEIQENPLLTATQTRQTIVNETNDKIVQPDLSNEESPRKLISGYQFLLGRKVIKNIIQGGTLLIPKDKTIDVDTVELARKYGKLVELTVSSVEK